MNNTTLYYRQGASDKVYQARIEPQGNGYVVVYAYGRRGSTLSTGSKTQTPVDLEKAKAIFDKLIQEKQAKGYTPGEDGTPYQHTDKESQNAGIHCQLLNPVEEAQVEQLINDPDFWMQEKFDGKRLLIRKEGPVITGINRLGLTVALPQPLVDDALRCAEDFLMDGEVIGEIFHAFDLLAVNGKDLRGEWFHRRSGRLYKLLSDFEHPSIRRVLTACTPEEKREIFDQLKARSAEGVVLKGAKALYTAGRPNTGGSQLKYKFCETASFIVTKVNAKRSVSLALFTGDKAVNAGNVTIPPNHELPQAGQVVEVRFLYAFPESGSIYQPVYLGVRDDIAAEECTTGQLKYKAA